MLPACVCMKIHIGADVDSGAVHSVEITAAHEADIKILAQAAAGARRGHLW
jgi:hypothetical protein